MSWSKLLEWCQQKGLKELLIEGGSRLYSSAFEADIVNKLICFISPSIIGQTGATSFVNLDSILNLSDSIRLTNVSYLKSGPDLQLTGEILRVNKQD